MLEHMRTTVDIPDALADDLRRHLAGQGRTLRDAVIEGLQIVLRKPATPFRLTDGAFTGTVGFAAGPGPDLADLRDDPAERGPAQP
jgi:hypothetical protein